VYNSREYRDSRINKVGNQAPTVNMATPWLEGYAVDICGKLLPPIKTDKDPYGITTKGDGVIYINPTVKSAAGHNATLYKFATSIGMTIDASEIQVPGGHPYLAGDNCEGKPGNVYVMTWSNPTEPRQDGTLQNKKLVDNLAPHVREDTCNPDCDSGVLLEDDQLVTIAFLPAPPKHESLVVLQPPASVVAHLESLEASGGTTTTSTPATTSVTTGTTTSKGTTTTSKGATTTSRGPTTSTGATTTTS
jgi:hypothetical protein